jgi:hypothetical protein
VKRDFLAIPHEVGHFVFWHGHLDIGGKEEIIANYFEDNTPRDAEWAYRWREELFADIYGSYVAGPLLALSFQDLHLQQAQTDFYKDDWDHPPAVLRPNVYTKGVHRAGFRRWAELLNERWNGKSGSNGKRHERTERTPKSDKSPDNIDYTYEFRLKPNNPTDVKTKAISLDPTDRESPLPVNKLIKFIVDNVIDRLGVINPVDNWWRRAIEDNGTADSTVADLEKLLEDFPAKFEQFQFGQVLDPGVPNKTKFTSAHYEVLKDRWEARSKKEVTDPVWYRAFGAGGWTTEGPEGNPTGP